MTNETTNETSKRVSKLDTLNAALVTAKASLASAQATLQPQIDAEQDRVNALRSAYEKADKVSSKAYDTHQSVVRAAEARLFPAEAKKKLLEAIKAKVGEQFPHANFVRLSHEHQGRVVSADDAVVAAQAAREEAYQAREKVYRAYNVAQAYDSKLHGLTRKLDGFKDRVSELEKEIERLPVRNAAARDRRTAEKQEKLEAEQTQAARALLAEGFDWAAKE